jgi:thioredoxin-like negative regulator of GroEL
MKQVLKFSAAWCGPCQALGMTIKSEDDWGVEIKEIDIDEELDMASQYGIRSVPTLVMLENGAEVKRKSGALNKVQLKEFING